MVQAARIIPRMPATDQPVIELRDIERVYRRREAAVTVRALAGVSCSIPTGQYVCIMGQSGSGKSTMMNLIGCLDRPTAGTYLLEGRDVSTLDDTALSKIRNRRIGFVFQSFNLIPELTVLENVEVPLFYRGIHRKQRGGNGSCRSGTSRSIRSIDAPAQSTLRRTAAACGHCPIARRRSGHFVGR